MQVNKVGEQKLFRLFGHFSLLILFSSTALLSSSFEDFKKSQDSSFVSYTDKRDSEFNKYLNSQWSEYSVYKGVPFYESPKPKNILSTQSKPTKSVGPKINIALDKLNPIVLKAESKPKPEKKDINFEFYGTSLGFNIDSNIKEATYFPQNQKGVSNFFNVMASSEYEYFVSSIEKKAKELELNDWGIYLLVNQIGSELFANRDSRNLFNWFIFTKLGYAVKIGLSNRHIVTLYYSKKVIYATPSYKFNGKKYYALAEDYGDNSGAIYSYNKEYPNAKKALDLSLHTLPKFEKNNKLKNLSFREFGKKYTFKYTYNQNIIDFMATYPQADYETFFNAPLDDSSYDELARGLKKHIDGMHASSAINFVLHFVQSAFKYELDSKQFGREKVMFAQETLLFDKSDCEDRAILFATLVSRIFNFSVVGVKYKDHMATAIYVPMSGDSVDANGRRFVLADPTYVNANIGQSMPKYRSKIPESFIIVNK